MVQETGVQSQVESYRKMVFDIALLYTALKGKGKVEQSKE